MNESKISTEMHLSPRTETFTVLCVQSPFGTVGVGGGGVEGGGNNDWLGREL